MNFSLTTFWKVMAVVFLLSIVDNLYAIKSDTIPTNYEPNHFKCGLDGVKSRLIRFRPNIGSRNLGTTKFYEGYGNDCINNSSNLAPYCGVTLRYPIALVRDVSSNWTNNQIIQSFNHTKDVFLDVLNIELYNALGPDVVREYGDLNSGNFRIPNSLPQWIGWSSSQFQPNVPAVIGFTNTITAANGDILNGIAFLPQGGPTDLSANFTWIGHSTNNTERNFTFIHELGHHFGLLHTFDTKLLALPPFLSTPDTYNASSCNLGDAVADTPGTPVDIAVCHEGKVSELLCTDNIDYCKYVEFSLSSPCAPVICKVSTVNGQKLFDNYMSYTSSFTCGKEFTPFQIRRMQDMLLTGGRCDICVKPERPEIRKGANLAPTNISLVSGLIDNANGFFTFKTANNANKTNDGNCVHWRLRQGTNPIANGKGSNISLATYLNNITLLECTTYTLDVWDAPEYNTSCESDKRTMTITVCPSCMNAQQDGMETGVDCGGNCMPCMTNCVIQGSMKSQFCKPDQTNSYYTKFSFNDPNSNGPFTFAYSHNPNNTLAFSENKDYDIPRTIGQNLSFIIRNTTTGCSQTFIYPAFDCSTPCTLIPNSLVTSTSCDLGNLNQFYVNVSFQGADKNYNLNVGGISLVRKPSQSPITFGPFPTSSNLSAVICEEGCNETCLTKDNITRNCTQGNIKVTGPPISKCFKAGEEILFIKWTPTGTSANGVVNIEACEIGCVGSGCCETLAINAPDNGSFEAIAGEDKDGNLYQGQYVIKIYDPSNPQINVGKPFSVSLDCSNSSIAGAPFGGLQPEPCHQIGTPISIGPASVDLVLELCKCDATQCFVVKNPIPANTTFNWAFGQLEDGSYVSPGCYIAKLYNPANTNQVGFSENLNVQTTCSSCTSVSNIQSTNISNGQNGVTFSWTDVLNNNGYQVELSQDNGNSWSVISNNVTTNSTSISSLPSCISWDLRVATKCTDGSLSDYSSIEFLTSGCDGNGISAGITTDCPGDDEDTDPPVFLNCPPNNYVFAIDNANECSAQVNWSVPVAFDNCNVSVTNISGINPGTSLPAGSYIISYLAEDNNSNTETCTFSVEVIDGQTLQFINCPTGPYVFGNDPDQCSVTANWSIPVATDNCAVTINHISGPQPGDVLAPGTYTVVYEATNNATPAETATCSFQVIINETQNPELNCPQDVTVSNDPGVCEAAVDRLQLEFSFDNCPYTVTWTSSPTDVTGTGTSTSTNASGAIFPVGVTTVTYTITENEDNGNGIQSSSCDIIVTVIDDETPMITCPANVTIGTSMGGIDDCEGEYTWTHPTPTDNCGVTVYTITYTNPDGSTEGPINLVGLGGTSITRDFYKGLSTMLYHVEDAAGNIIECTFTVTVLDDENPEIFCEEVVATNRFTYMGPRDIKPNDTTQVVIHVAPSMTITDVNILSLIGTQPDMGALRVTLTSPAGTQVTLFDALCTNTADFDMQLDDAATTAVASSGCAPLGSGGLVIPQEALAMFNSENSAGDWILTFHNAHVGKCGVLQNFTIEIIGNDITPTANRLQVLADPGTCTYTMLGTNFNPRFTDNCPNPYIRHNYIFGPFDSTLQGSQFALGENLITWTVYDQSGNTASCNIIVDVLDTQAPQFTNCPRLDIIQNVETERCGAYVTFSEPLAVDNCASVLVTKTDGTGLNSGSIFPTGTSILEYLAIDPSGNTAVCSLRVIVNDHIPPTMECPPSVTESTDPWKCSAIVNNIAPQKVNDNCRDNLSIQYQIEYPLGSGIIVDGGMADASGEEFLDGVSQVTYKLSDQPHLLITEVTHDIGITNGGMDPVPYTVLTTNDYVEITNLGAASINASGLQVERLGNMMVEVLTIPDNTIIGVGQTLVIHFGNGTDDPANLFFNVLCAIDMHTSQGAAYVMSFKGRVLDVVAVNGFAPIGLGSVAVVGAADWTGSIPTMRSKGGVIRKFSFDNHVAGDWKVADVCDPITIGIVNPTIDISPDNGTTIGFQSIMPNMVTCQFKVTILDQELPYCGEFVENVYNGATNLNVANSITGGKVFKSVINVPDSYLVGDVDLLDIIGQHPNMRDLIFKVTSPEGTQVVLFEGLCPGTANFDLSLDSDSLVSVINAPCGPLGQGGTFAPINSLCAVNTAFYGENAQGNWTLEIADTTAANNGLLSNWTLRLWEINNYSQGDTTYNNEPGLCGADFTWVHPRIIDNCKVGTVELKYLSDTDIPLPTSPGIIVQADTLTEFFAVGTTTVRYILTDGSGNIDSCEFKVTIRDIDRPHVSCPADIVVYLKGGECRAPVCYWPILATDNCAVTDTTYSIEPCTFFEIGTTPVTITVSDAASNTHSCSFNVIIVEYIPNGNTLTCNDHLNLSLDQDCQAEITPDMLFEGSEYRCYEDYIVTLKDATGNILATSPFVYLEHEGKTLTYEVLDPTTGNSCWGTILIEAKAIPLIECPADTMIYCSTNKDLKDEFGHLLLGEVVLKSCKPDVQVTREDVIVKNAQCSDPIATIYRTFVVSDKVGNEASCTQNITVKAFDFDQIVWPANIALTCDTVSKYPRKVHPDSLGYPTIDGVIVDKVNALCNLSHTYEDQYLWICGGSYEIIRKWVIRNRCEALSATNPIVHYQLIEVLDSKAPTLQPCPDQVLLSVDPWTCAGSGFLPIPENIGDKCSASTFKAYIYGGGFIEVTGSLDSSDLKVYVQNIKKGANTRVKYVLEDACGNESICIFPVRVIDQTPPIPVAKQNIVVSLTGDANGGGEAKLYAYQVDNGSYDQCTPVKLEVRRLDGNVCGNVGSNGTHNNNITYNNNNGNPSEIPGSIWFHPNDNSQDVDGGEFVKFCCEDIPSGEEFGLHDVEMRVWDDGNMNGIYGDNLIINGMKDNYNTTWVTVRVENKLPPVLICPPDITVTCDMELNLSLDQDTPVSAVDLVMTGKPKASDLCTNIDITYRDAWIGTYNEVCKSGTLRRTFKVTKGNTVVTCAQLITVSTVTIPFTVTFPQDNGTTEWNRCSFNIDDAKDAANPTIKKPIINYGQCDVVGENIKIDTFLFEDGTCKKWKVSYSYKNWCTGEDKGPFVHYYTYKDEIAPTLTCNNQMFAANPNAQNPNGGCESAVVLEATAMDSLLCAEESWLKWQMFFDGWADNTVDRLASSFVNKSWNGIWVSQSRLIAGQPNPIWIALQNQHPNTTLADVVLVTYVKPTKASGETVKLPAFTLDAENISHKVLWKITDGCGNVDQCESTLMVVDKKAPTPYCVSLNSAIMPSNPRMVELWAKDFDKGAFDNCSPQSQLYFTFNGVAPIFARINDEHYFKPSANGSINATQSEYNSGNAYKWVPSARSAGKVWTSCGDFTVEVSVWDEAWNTDYCSGSLNIRGCDGNRSVVAGAALTPTGSNVPDVDVIFASNIPEFPKTVTTTATGQYQLDLDAGLNYEVRAIKEGDYLNGVTTLDLVLIQRHILGLSIFDEPYKLIASDANNDGRITASDLTEIRKVILGIAPSFKNASWRFPIKYQSLDTQLPFPYKEVYYFTDLQEDKLNQDFTAVKIGDVNASVTINSNSPNTEVRSNNNLILLADEVEMEAGESVEIPITAINCKEMAGFQLTLNLKGASLIAINNGAIDIRNNIGILDNGTVTMSYAASENVTLTEDEILFTLVVKSTKKALLSELISLGSGITKAESYTRDLHVAGVSLNIRNKSLSKIELFQNEPNPFKGQTTINFFMPQATSATLSVYDLSGKLLEIRKIDAVKGMNSEILSKESVGSSGVLYYTLESGDFLATKKMIIVE